MWPQIFGAIWTDFGPKNLGPAPKFWGRPHRYTAPVVRYRSNFAFVLTLLNVDLMYVSCFWSTYSAVTEESYEYGGRFVSCSGLWHVWNVVGVCSLDLLPLVRSGLSWAALQFLLVVSISPWSTEVRPCQNARDCGLRLPNCWWCAQLWFLVLAVFCVCLAVCRIILYYSKTFCWLSVIIIIYVL